MQTFEFNKPGENPIPTPAPAPVEEQHEIEGTEPAIQPDPAPVQSSEPDAIGEAGETALNAPPAPAPATAGDKKHHLTYLGNGIWTDANGKTWCRESKKGCITGMTMTDAELADRPDIKFMVKYGAIKDIIV